jgi:MFS family permease
LGERLLLATGTVIAGIGYLLLGFSPGFGVLLVLLLLVGFGSAVQHPLSSSLVARAYEDGPRRAALGIYNFSGDIGKMVLPATIAVIAGAIGWRTGTLAFGIAGIAFGLVVFIVLHRLGAGSAAAQNGQPKTDAAVDADAGGTPDSGAWGIRDVSGFRAISAINVIDTIVIYGFLTFLPFLVIEKGAGVETVGLAMALVFGGGAAGKFACGVLAERIGIIRTAVITLVLKGVGIIVLIYLPLAAVLVFLPLVGGALNGTSSVLYASVAEFVDPHRHSRAFGLFYTLGIGSGAVSPPVFGLVSDVYGVPVAIVILGLINFLSLPFCRALSRSF